jgi:hypothetical protein
MASIPKLSTIQRTIPNPQGDINTSGAGANISQGLADVAQASSDQYRSTALNQMAKAKADMSVDTTAEATALKNDPNFSTQTERFTSTIEQKLGEHAATISDPGARQAFITQMRPQLANARAQVKSNAWAKEVDHEKAQLGTRLETLRNSAIVSGDITDANNTAKELIQSHVQLNHIGEQDAVKLQHGFRDSLSKGYIEAQPPEKQSEILKQPWAKKYLAPDEYAVMKRKADQELLVGKSQQAVDGYMASDMGRDQVMKDIGKKYAKQPELRKEVEQRYDYALNAHEKAVTEHQSSLFDQYFLPVRSGKMIVDQIPEKDIEALSPAQQNNLFAAQQSSVSRSSPSFNVKAEDDLNNLYKEKRFPELRKYFTEHAGSMSDSQNKTWSKITVDGAVPPDVKSLFSANASIDAKVPGYSKENKGKLKAAMNTWYQNYQEMNGKVPTDDVVNKQIDRMITEYDTNGMWPFGGKPYYQMTDQEKKKMIAEAKIESDKAGGKQNTFDDTTEYFKRIGIQPDAATFLDAYNKLKAQRGE